MSVDLQHLAAWPEVIRFGWALVYFMWQGAVIFALLELALLLMGRRNAAHRYVACGTALGLMPVCLVVTYLALGVQPSETGSPVFVPQEQAGVRTVEVSVSHPLTFRASPAIAEVAGTPSIGLDRYIPLVVAGWLFGVLLLGLRKVGGLYVVWRLRSRGLAEPSDALIGVFHRSCLRLGLDPERVRLHISSLVSVPVTVGWLKPVVLVPVSLVSGLAFEDIEMLLAHELAHIRRHDYLVNLIQTVVETIFFYHPVSWWISRRIRQERENICDDLAAPGRVAALAYAKVLVQLETSRPAGSWLVAGANGGTLLQRVERLAQERTPAPVAGMSVALVVVGFLLVLAVASLIKAKDIPPPDASTIMTAAEARQKGIAAMVNQHPILGVDIATHPDAVASVEKKQTNSPSRQEILQALIDRELIIQQYKREMPAISPGYANYEADWQIKNNYGGDRARFLKSLSDHSSSLDRYRQSIVDETMVSMMRSKHIYLPVSDYFQQHLDQFPVGDKINISVIQISSDAPANGIDTNPDDRPEAKLAHDILKKVRAGADFTTFSHQYRDLAFDHDRSYWVRNSQDGYSGVPGYLPVKWADLDRMQPGQTTDVLRVEALNPKSTYSFYIIRVNDRRPGTAPLNDQNLIGEKIILNGERDKLRDAWLADLRSKASIQLFADDTDVTGHAQFAGIKRETPSRLAISLTAQPVAASDTKPPEQTAQDTPASGAWLPPSGGQAKPSDVFVDTPQVTVGMEQAFLAKYKAAIARQDAAAYLALFDSKDVGPDPFRKDVGSSLFMASVITRPAYVFAPIIGGELRGPELIKGRTYVDNTPSVITLKATATDRKPDSIEGSSQPLGLENGQLVMIGVHEDEHAVAPLPPAPAPIPPNYDLKPNARPVTASSLPFKFDSEEEFLAALRQPALQVLERGQNDYTYYALCRLEPNLLILAVMPRGEHSNYQFMLNAQDAAKHTLSKKSREIDLVDNISSDGVWPDIQGDVFEVPSRYHGELTVRMDFAAAGIPSKSITDTRSVDWK